MIGRAVELPLPMASVGAFGSLAEVGLVGLCDDLVIMAVRLLIVDEWL